MSTPQAFLSCRAFLLKTVGPKPVLESVLGEVFGTESAFIYGSWARRYAGEAGAPPGDIDLLVVGTPRVDAVYDVTEKASSQLGREVNPTVLTQHEWEKSTERVHRTASPKPARPVGHGSSHQADATSADLMALSVEALLDSGRNEHAG